MDIKNNYEIREVTHKEAYRWLLKIHYAKRVPIIIHSFGLFDKTKKVCVGIVTFGKLPSAPEEKAWKPFELLELNRLCVIPGLERGVLSYFVSNALKMLPRPRAIISFADIDYNHAGYIYQATNWIYTGIGSEGSNQFILKDGTSRHQRTISKAGNKKFYDIKEIKKGTGKHRYYYFIGNSKEVKQLKKILLSRYKTEPYPKLAPNHYDITNKIDYQTQL